MPRRARDDVELEPHNEDFIAHDSGDDFSVWSPRIYIAEFIGTFALTFAIIATRGNTPGGPSRPPAGGLVGVALVHSFVLMAFAAAFGSISGGHFNPAVTLTFILTREIHWLAGLGYMLAQFLAGLAAGGVALGVVGEVTGAAPLLGDGVDPGQGFGAELLGTFFLLMVIFGAGVSGHGSDSAYVAIGFALGLGVLFAGPVTNACLNPARALGAAAVADQSIYVWTDFWLYIIAPFVASVCTAVIWGLVFQSTSDNSKHKNIIAAWMSRSD
eukprot:CAMPEP_0198337474 /NCGR_PEP_ID=MMETSP1450-20131203/28652_1 /TAXON_ID=753684 ORGANISM="Madagascaria erythrocladiodes, Strain CCMP3234" /NCGR_SAMPLE_ID=MMETSP1450 /ASSEMBLY_ACC=CAM_ASM_001115 /LENGTH=270 /DNA_ID=CAMNT_0044042281 /DNA_START=34 /DNA_END=846 /DNA_ORIENTATION=+